MRVLRDAAAVRVLWRCPDCERAIHLSVDTAKSQQVGPNTYRASVDTRTLELAITAHERSHQREL